MPSRKQRRRRAKERRHEYEFVYVDEEGRELEVDESELPDERGRPRERKSDAKRDGRGGRGGRAARPVQPPSWNKVGRRALIFFPLIFIAFSLVNRHQALGTRLLVTVIYTAFFVPFMYLMDRAMYRAYLKRTGQAGPRRPERRR